MKQYKIEKNIPMPTTKRVSAWESVIANMKVGDSILVESESEAKSFYAYVHNNGGGSIYRRQADGTYRIWLSYALGELEKKKK